MAVGAISGANDVSIDFERQVERAKRTKKYREDLFNSSHAVEQRPVDSASNGTHRHEGWTTNVMTLPSNTIVQLDHDGEPLNVKTEKEATGFAASVPWD